MEYRNPLEASAPAFMEAMGAMALFNSPTVSFSSEVVQLTGQATNRARLDVNAAFVFSQQELEKERQRSVVLDDKLYTITSKGTA